MEEIQVNSLWKENSPQVIAIQTSAIWLDPSRWIVAIHKPAGMIMATVVASNIPRIVGSKKDTQTKYAA